MPIPGLPTSGYRLLSSGGGSASFGVRLGDEWENDLWVVNLRRNDGRWGFFNGGECTPRTLRDGIEAAHWDLASAADPPADATEIPIELSELACTGGASLAGRIQEPDVVYRPHRVLVTMYVTPLEPVEEEEDGIVAHTCVGVAPTPYTVTLTEPLSDREILDGGTFPPRPPAPL